MVFLPKVNTDKLESSELRYRRLFETAQDGILILDADSGKIEDVNPFLKNILGYSNSEFVGKELWEIGVFKDIIDSKKAFLELQHKGYIRYEDLPLHTKDGRLIDVEFVSNVYIVDNQRVIQCNIRDITARKKTEEVVRLRTKELEKLTLSQEETKGAMLNVMEDLEEAKAVIEIEKATDEAMLASIGEGLIAVDIDKKIMIINKAAEQMLGWEMKNMIGKPLTSFPALSSNKMTHRTFFYVRKDKTQLPLVITVTPIKLNGKKIGAIIIFRDATREREIDRAKSEFVSLASHQLRTPLGISKWYLEALAEEGSLDCISNKAKDYLIEVYKSNERLLALVRGLLSVSRIDQGTAADVPKKINIIKLIKEVMREMNIMASKNNITINLKFGKTKIPTLFVDPLRMQQVIENLISNAVEYSNLGGTIEIMVGKKADQVFISVKDTGIGISSMDQRKLFTKFFRSVKATIKNTEGTGLGLYVVKSYIEGWGGDISIKSAEGEGSTFTVTLPVRFKKNGRSRAKLEESYELGGSI